MMAIFWFIVVGSIAGIIARFLLPGPKTFSEFILTVLVGIAGAFAGAFTWTFAGQVAGWYRPDQGANYFIAAPIGALLVLLIWAAWGTISRT